MPTVELDAFAGRVLGHGYGGPRRVLVVGDEPAAAYLRGRGVAVETAAEVDPVTLPEHTLDGLWLASLPDAGLDSLFRAVFRALHHGFVRVPRQPSIARSLQVELALERADLRVVECLDGLIAWTKLVPPTLGAGGVVFDPDDRVLLTDRADGRGWCIPGGVADAHEAPMETVVRELREETGLEVEVEQLLGVYSGWNAWGRIVVTEFICQIVGGEPTLTDETKAMGWFAESEIPIDLLPLHRIRLRDAWAVRRGLERPPFVRDGPERR